MQLISCILNQNVVYGYDNIMYYSFLIIFQDNNIKRKTYNNAITYMIVLINYIFFRIKSKFFASSFQYTISFK